MCTNGDKIKRTKTHTLQNMDTHSDSNSCQAVVNGYVGINAKQSRHKG